LQAEQRDRRAVLLVEVEDREQGRAWLESATGYRRDAQVRVATLEACLRHGWLAVAHERVFAQGLPLSNVWFVGRSQPTVVCRELTLTEDGVIALGVWRERKLKADPLPVPTLNDREREVVGLAHRALELGYALCAREPARREAASLRRRGWFDRSGCWVANNASGLVPTAMAVVEVAPDQADHVSEQARRA
jgi:hypothetical protein